jgi:hypothetical protein
MRVRLSCSLTTCRSAMALLCALCVCVVCVLSACISRENLGDRAASDAGAPVFDLDALFALPDGFGFPRSGTGKRMFVTSKQYTGDLRSQGGAGSGLAGGDALCNQEAREAELPGVFKAWLSDAREQAKDRIAAVGPWYFVTGEMVFGERTPGAARPRLFTRTTAQGVNIFGFDVAWTGTNERGFRAPEGNACRDWTSSAPSDQGAQGDVFSASEWTRVAIEPMSLGCDKPAHLYCFEQ